MNKIELPKKISIFPLSNFIIFPKTAVPLNIFEPRYIEMVNESMKSNKLIGMIQPKISNDNSIPDAPLFTAQQYLPPNLLISFFFEFFYF